MPAGGRAGGCELPGVHRWETHARAHHAIFAHAVDGGLDNLSVLLTSGHRVVLGRNGPVRDGAAASGLRVDLNALRIGTVGVSEGGLDAGRAAAVLDCLLARDHSHRRAEHARVLLDEDHATKGEVREHRRRDHAVHLFGSRGNGHGRRWVSGRSLRRDASRDRGYPLLSFMAGACGGTESI